MNEGRRSPVLFLHSLAGDAAHWEAQIRHLMPERMGLAVELPGHGISAALEPGGYAPASMASEIWSTVDVLALAPLALVGHSYGAAVAIAMLAQRPDAVRGILLVDPAPDLRQAPPEEITGFLASLAPPTYEAAIREHFEGALEDARPDVRETVLESLGRTPREVVVRALESLPGFDPVGPLHAFEGPKMAVLRRRPEAPSDLHVAVPGLRARGLPAVSHWLHMDAPAEFNAILHEFLGEVDAA
jgi:pimeloyl-ACP methyl ester carboxylesterase